MVNSDFTVSATSCPRVNGLLSHLCGGYNYGSTSIRRPFDCLSKVITVTLICLFISAAVQQPTGRRMVVAQSILLCRRRAVRGWMAYRINAVATTTVRLRFDSRSTAYQRSLRSRWSVYLFRPQCSSPQVVEWS